ncbi:polysaccharide lyase 6 family protein [Actinocatenispora rupis]|uniref:Lyase n=1 Tax=Actinocatenispora rupis TaxID=519421 RepID=A0A8J3N9K6_9ACTN|nr:polysaccharide lyase 6 family protein [Actinocatenispora rupis]GID11404.1 lyase [Actinocatenispora rupis]
MARRWLAAVLAAGCVVLWANPASAGRRVDVSVSDSATLAAAMSAATAGSTIVLADGDYTIGKLAAKLGTKDAPVTIRAAHPGKARITAGQLEIKDSEYVTVRGLDWANANTLKVTASRHVRLTDNHFRLGTPAGTHWVLISGENSGHNRIDHNTFEHKTLLGNYVTVYGGQSQVSQYDRIDHNLFADEAAQTANGGEAIRLGVSQLSESSAHATVEYNLFSNCDGDAEIVSVKTSDNTVRYNTFRESAGVLSARRGDRNSFYGNVFLGGGKPGTGGIRLYGEDQRVYDNYFAGLTGSGFTAAIQLDGGTVTADADHTDPSLWAQHWQVRHAVVTHNTFVGNVSNVETGANYTYPPVDSVVADNVVVGSTGALYREAKAPTGQTYQGNIAWPTGDATVGLDLPADQIRVVDPKLAADGEIAHLTAGSPAIDAATGSFPYVTDDVDGQPRDARPDAGADELSTAPVTRHPLTTADVGTSW